MYFYELPEWRIVALEIYNLREEIIQHIRLAERDDALEKSVVLNKKLNFACNQCDDEESKTIFTTLKALSDEILKILGVKEIPTDEMGPELMEYDGEKVHANLFAAHRIMDLIRQKYVDPEHFYDDASDVDVRNVFEASRVFVKFNHNPDLYSDIMVRCKKERPKLFVVN